MTRRSTLFCGIDIGKSKHTACLIDADGNFVFRSQNFTNDASGFALFLKRLSEVSQGRPVLIGMEATGHYWYALHEYLVGHHYKVVALNPVQTAEQARRQIRKTKTDRVD